MHTSSSDAPPTPSYLTRTRWVFYVSVALIIILSVAFTLVGGLFPADIQDAWFDGILGVLAFMLVYGVGAALLGTPLLRRHLGLATSRLRIGVAFAVQFLAALAVFWVVAVIVELFPELPEWGYTIVFVGTLMAVFAMLAPLTLWVMGEPVRIAGRAVQMRSR